MREIKFRVWQENHMFYQKMSGIQGILEFFKQFYYDLEEKCIMQFTGLHDKNGKEIYGNDILKLINNDIQTVNWFKKTGYAISGWNVESERDYEIIGNTYENPELVS